jgi:hypothetical protein
MNGEEDRSRDLEPEKRHTQAGFHFLNGFLLMETSLLAGIIRKMMLSESPHRIISIKFKKSNYGIKVTVY